MADNELDPASEMGTMVPMSDPEPMSPESAPASAPETSQAAEPAAESQAPAEAAKEPEKESEKPVPAEAKKPDAPGASKTKRGLSLKYKLLILLVALPLVSLSLYLMLATRLFESDKLAYVFDSTGMAIRGISARTKLEIENDIKSLVVIAEEFHDRSKSFGPGGKAQLQRTPSILADRVYRLKSGRKPELVGNLARPEKSLEADLEEALKKAFQDDEATKDLIKQATELGGAAMRRPTTPAPADMVQVVKLWGKDGKTITHAVVAWLKLEALQRSYAVVSSYTGFLAAPSGKVIFGPDPSNKRGEKVDSFGEWKFFNDMKAKKVNDSTVEVPSPDGNALLASYSQIGIGDMVAIGLVRKKEALKAVDILITKSLIFFVALISFAVMTAVLASGKLTRTLRQLYTATEKVSGGDFNIEVKVQSTDEVGSLADAFNRMAAKISELLKETADKARMEKELETAKTVQETLFPASTFKSDKVQLAGVYQPASECGGDWWHHCVIGKKLFIWVGDATGHGVPAALLTSAARSASCIIERLPNITPKSAMKFLNSSIHYSSKGGMMMTFFIASIDLETGELTYANASHDSPFLLRNTRGKLTKKSIEPLNEVNSPRLGEKNDHDYEECTIQMEPGDAVFLYTDGVPDVKSPEGVHWGQKAFIKSITTHSSNGASADEAVAKIHAEAMDYRKDTELPDDVTFVLCKYQ